MAGRGSGQVPPWYLPHIVTEATGVGQVVFDAMAHSASYGTVCLTGVSAAGRWIGVDGDDSNRELVLENDVVVGWVKANPPHYRQAADSLAKADIDRLDELITRRVPLGRAAEALTALSDDVKVVITLNDSDG